MKARRRRITNAVALLFIGAAETPGGALAQTPDLRIEVTGSNIIRRIESETALPVQIITREEIERANLLTAAEIVGTISANLSFGAFTEAQGLGPNARQPGIATASLRGVGQQSTLILLNGRRIANYAYTTIGGDLNAIPVSAIARVEVLLDGASAIYGSDAIAGVINFVLRKDYQGAEATAQYTSPEHTGGYSTHFNVAAGYGDLTAQGFNAYATVDYLKYGGIQARDRPFAATSYIPGENYDRTGDGAVPANIFTPVGFRNPTGDPANGYRNPTCAPPLSFPTQATANNPNSPNECRWDGAGTSSIVDPSERINAVGAFIWRIDPDNELFVTGVYARNHFTFNAGPTNVTRASTYRMASAVVLPPASAFYPLAFAQFFGLQGPLNVRWRAYDLGDRTVEPTSQQWNVVAGMKGTFHGWDYDGAFNYNQSSVDSQYTHGFLRESAFLPIFNSGVVNPFAANTSEVIALMRTAEISGTLRTAKASTMSFDLHASKDVWRLPAGSLALAVGAEARRERLAQWSDPALESGDVMQLIPIASMSGTREVWAVFTEASIPIVKSLEADIAVRYDHYSDFGGTTNPKLSVRWQPTPSWLLRGSVGTGFFAPSLNGLYSPSVLGFTVGGLQDPVRCPVTGSPDDCGRSFPALGGGNPNLQPLTSNQWSIGGVWSPYPQLSFSLDYVEILMKNRIAFFQGADVLRQCPDGVSGPTCYLIQRGPVDPAYPSLPGPILRVDEFFTNLGNNKVTAIDVTAQYRLPPFDWGQVKLALNGTYTIHSLYQQLQGGYADIANNWGTSGDTTGAVPFWRHYFVLDWNLGPWSLTLTENYQTGTYDQSPNPDSGGKRRMVGDYDIWNIAGSYNGFKNFTLSAGIKNLLDRAPPFSNRMGSSQNGYDAAYGDPHGRLFWASVKYAFK